MRFEIEVLDGPHKGKKISLNSSLVYGRKTPIDFNDSDIADAHFRVYPDHKNVWNIECLGGNKIRIGSAEANRFALLKGLVFHLGQTALKVVERPALAYETWEDGLKDWLSSHPANPTQSEFFFFLKPVRLTFVQGAQLGDFYTLSYGPRYLGHNHIDLNIKDPHAPALVAKFFQVGDQAYIENLSSDRIKINGKPFVQHPIVDGDILMVGADIVELSIL